MAHCHECAVKQRIIDRTTDVANYWGSLALKHANDVIAELRVELAVALDAAQRVLPKGGKR